MRYFKSTTATSSVAVTGGARRVMTMRVERCAIRVVVEVALFGDQIRSVRSMLFGSENSGARLAEERGVADEGCDARDEVRGLRARGAAIRRPVERPAAIASGVDGESNVVRQKGEMFNF